MEVIWRLKEEVKDSRRRENGDHAKDSPPEAENSEQFALINRFRPRNDKFDLVKPGSYQFQAELPYDLNISRSFLMKHLKAHERVKRFTSNSSRYSVSIQIVVQSKYAIIFEKKIVLQPPKSTTVSFELPKAFAPASCTVKIDGFAIKRLRVTSSLSRETRPDVRSSLQPVMTNAEMAKSKNLKRRKPSEVRRFARQLLKSLDEASLEAKLDSDIPLSDPSDQTSGHIDMTTEVIQYRIPSHSFLSKRFVVQISSKLRASLKVAVWTQRFDTVLHGSSLDRMYQNCSKKSEPQIIFVKDIHKHVFGIFLAIGMYIESRKGAYTNSIGEGESFVFTFRNCSPLEIYPWTKKNFQFRFLNSNGVGFGGGNQGFALWLSEDLSTGTSEISETFDNQILASSRIFTISAIEVWALNTNIFKLE